MSDCGGRGSGGGRVVMVEVELVVVCMPASQSVDLFLCFDCKSLSLDVSA